MHHVERGDAAAAGDALAVDHEAGRARDEVGEGFRQHRRVFPVDGEIPPREQARRREEEGPPGNAAEADPGPGKPVEGRGHPGQAPVLRGAAGADEEGVQVGQRVERGAGDRQAGGGQDILPVEGAERHPVEGSARDQVRRAQGFGDGRERHQRHIGQEQEAEMLGGGGRGGSHVPFMPRSVPFLQSFGRGLR